MNKIVIRSTECKQHIGRAVVLQGRIQAIRQMGGVTFVVLRDGWGTAQAVYETGLEALPALESVVRLSGTVATMPQAPDGIELHGPKIELLVEPAAPPPVPMHKKSLKTGLPTLLDNGVVLNRHPQRRAIFRLSAGVMAAFRSYLDSQYFTEIQSPKLVASATEGGANVFELGYFGRSAYLAQSPQFYKQIMVGVFDRVYEVGPVFRAEPHNTSRHINQYASLDVEFGFIENHFTVMELVERLLWSIFTELGERYEPELKRLEVVLPQAAARFPHIHFSEALELITRETGRNVLGEPDLAPEDERWLGEWAQREHGSDFLFVTGYPMGKRPFYTHPDPGRPEYSNSFDLLFRGTELITGGQRLHIYAEYLAALERAGLPTEPFAHYLQTFEQGMPPHGGFAIGLERLLKQLIGLPNVKLATLFPRDMGRLVP